MRRKIKINPHGLFYFCPIPYWVMRSETLSPVAKLVYGRLLSFAGSKGKAWPTVKHIAAEIGTPHRSVTRAMAELREHNVLSTERSPHHLNIEFYWHEWIEREDVRDDDKARAALADVGQQLTLPLWDEEEDLPRSRSKRSVISQSGVSDAPDWRMYPLKLDQLNRSDQEEAGPQPKAFGAFDEPSYEGEQARLAARAQRLAAQRRRRQEDEAQRPFEAKEELRTELEASERLRDAQRLVEASTQVARQQRAQNEKRATARRGVHAKTADARRHVEPAYRSSTELTDVWVEGCSRLTETPVARWSTARDFSMLKVLVTKYGGERVENLFRYVLSNWPALKRRFFKDKGGPVPQLGVVLRFHDSWEPEAGEWLKAVPVLEEFEQWQKKHGDMLIMPDETLMNRYNAAKKALKGLDLDV